MITSSNRIESAAEPVTHVSDAIEATVFVIDNDPEARARVCELARAEGMRCEPFRKAEDFLAADVQRRPSCIVMDLVLDGMSGLALQQHLRSRAQPIPVVAVTAQADVASTVQLLRNDAVTLIEKPCRDDELSSAIRSAITLDRKQLVVAARLQQLRERAAALSAREYEVLLRIMNGRLNKSIARELDVTQRTVENIRARIMNKFGATTAVQLARQFTELQLLEDIARCLRPMSLNPTPLNRVDMVEHTILSR